MAYGNIYYGGWHSLNGIKGYIYIDKDAYAGAATPLVIKDRSVEIEYGFQDWNDPVIGITASFSIVNDKTDYYELLPLLTSEERLYKIRIVVTSPSAYTLFEGFLNSDTITQRMLHRQEIRFYASSYLSKLEYVVPTFIETLYNEYFINAIDLILRQTGLENNIRVNCSLFSRYAFYGSNYAMTLFNMHTFFTEIFWEDNIKRKSSLEVLRSILRTFDCYLYWLDGYWYIESYEDIWCEESDLNQRFVEYTTGTLYHSDDEGVAVDVQKTLTDLHSLVFTEQSQEHSIIPGYKNIEIQLQDATLLNVFNPDLTNAIADTYGALQYPNVRTWQYYTSGGFYDFGKPYYGIQNGIKGNYPDESNLFKGISTRFNCTVNSDSEQGTVLNISFKYAFWFGGLYSTKDEATFRFYWYLRATPGNYYIIYDDGDSTWKLETGTETSKLQYKEVNGAKFKFVGTGSICITEVQLSIPLGDVVGLADGDASLVFNLGAVQIDAPLPYTTTYTYGVFGDFIATITEVPMDNVISGIATTKFLNKKEIQLDLFDIESFNYKNGIYFGAVRTIDWTSDEVTYNSLIDRLLKNKFQLFNSCRQQISGDIQNIDRLKPLQMFRDSKQSDKPFVLMSFIYYLCEDKYHVNLFEYNNTTAINLI